MRTRPNVLIMIESSRESGREYIKGIADYAHHFGPWHFDWKALGLRDLGAQFEMSHIDGVIARDMSPILSNIKPGTPVVLLRYVLEYAPQTESIETAFVQTDDLAISSVVANHFQQKGFRHFAFCGVRELAWSVNRGTHFTNAITAMGFPVECYWADVADDVESVESRESESLKKWLVALPKPVALMAANDEIGRLIVQLCQEAALRVPEECAIVGVDNDPVVCGLCNPPLSSVEVRFRNAGYRAAAILDKMMQGKTPEMPSIGSKVGDLVVRQSSDIIAVEDPAVARALTFISDTAALATTVDEIARASGLSRRVLEKRFRLHMSKSILTHHREVRADHIARILDETEFTLEEIAEQCGFAEQSNLTRFFHTVRGQSPSAYRKRHHRPN